MNSDRVVVNGRASPACVHGDCEAKNSLSRLLAAELAGVKIVLKDVSV